MKFKTSKPQCYEHQGYVLPEWGWQEAGRPEVWWGESSDDAEGAALAESARVGRPHQLVRVVAQTEQAPRGHWRMQATEEGE